MHAYNIRRLNPLDFEFGEHRTNRLNASEHIVEIADQQAIPVDADALIAIIRQILSDHQIQSAEISLALVDDPSIRNLNRQYLQHDYETDVISFVLDWEPDTRALTGQLIVSTQTASREADSVGSSFEEELMLYVIHGTLHLVGLDDKSADDALHMRAQEQKYLLHVGMSHRGFENTTPDEAGA